MSKKHFLLGQTTKQVTRMYSHNRNEKIKKMKTEAKQQLDIKRQKRAKQINILIIFTQHHL